MKTSILIAFSALSLVGCQTIDSSQSGNKEEITQEEQSNETTMSRMEFIEETFKSQNFKAPDKSQWQIKEEGPHKVVVIIKEIIPQQKPLITKLVLIDDGSYKIEFLQIENTIIIR